MEYNNCPIISPLLLNCITKYEEELNTFEKNFENIEIKSSLFLKKNDENICEEDIIIDRINSILNYLDTQGYPRTSTQRDVFHKSFIGACLSLIYGKKLNENLPRIMNKYGYKRIQNDVLISTPRRHGKTHAVALFVAAIMIAIPGIHVCIYSTGRRASKMILNLIKEIVSTYYKGMERNMDEKNKNVEEFIFVSHFSSNQKSSKCEAFPASITGKSSFFC